MNSDVTFNLLYAAGIHNDCLSHKPQILFVSSLCNKTTMAIVQFHNQTVP